MIAILTGLSAEAGVVQDRSRALVLCGSKDLQALDAMVPETCDGMLGFSVVGGLSPRVKVGDVCLARGVITVVPGGTIKTFPSGPWTDRLARILASLHPVECDFVSDPVSLGNTPASRAALHARTGADAVDMGSYAIESWAARHKKPFAVVGTISDAWDQSVTANPAIMNADGSPNIAEILKEAEGDPKLYQELMTEAGTFVRAIWSLRSVYRLLVPAAWGVA